VRHVDRILGGDHKKRIRQPMGHAIQRHLLLRHRFEQGALRARRRAIDFIGQQQVAEHRAGMELEAAAMRFVDRDAEHIGRQQIGGELHALELQAEAGCHRMGEGGLAEPWQVFDQQMPAGQQRDKGHAYFLGLAQQ